jgi:hypothetical protein
MFNVGDIVVAKRGRPAHFRNIKDGSIWKVTASDGRGGIRVGDKNHPNGIGTKESNFVKVPHVQVAQFTDCAVLSETSLGIRLGLITEFKPELGYKPATNQVAATVSSNDGLKATLIMDKELASALSSRGGKKIVQKKLALALGRF